MRMDHGTPLVEHAIAIGLDLVDGLVDAARHPAVSEQHPHIRRHKSKVERLNGSMESAMQLDPNRATRAGRRGWMRIHEHNHIRPHGALPAGGFQPSTVSQPTAGSTRPAAVGLRRCPTDRLVRENGVDLVAFATSSARSDWTQPCGWNSSRTA